MPTVGAGRLTATPGRAKLTRMSGTSELPKIISVDDHVVEPPHVWQTWLPEKYREQGPRVERKQLGRLPRTSPAPATT